jgi:hypothetical protein
MKNKDKNEKIRDLGDGLILRRSNPQDAPALQAFNAKIHSESDQNESDERVGVWTRDLLEKPHPTFSPHDFTIIEDTRSRKIVSTLNLISQTWTYAGIPFGVGRVELVGTLPEYRKRGLVRAQFEEVHKWSQQRGHQAQMITGIPYYYRLFGYEMALNLGGGRTGYKPDVPKLKEGEREPYHLRPAGERDLAFISKLYNAGQSRYLIGCQWDEALWRYELSGKSHKNVNRQELRIIESAQGEPVGFLAHPFLLWGEKLSATWFEVSPETSWAVVTPSVVRYLYATGESYAQQEQKQDQFGAFGFALGAEHPAYQVLQDRLPKHRKPYAWYVRVPDLPGFLRLIKPILEQRLAESVLRGHSGELKITFYRSGLHLQFEQGRLVVVEEWQPSPQGHSGEAAFPGQTFLQLIFGYRSLEELDYAFPDCWYENEIVFALLEALFPKQNSDIWPIA